MSSKSTKYLNAAVVVMAIKELNKSATAPQIITLLSEIYNVPKSLIRDVINDTLETCVVLGLLHKVKMQYILPSNDLKELFKDVNADDTEALERECEKIAAEANEGDDEGDGLLKSLSESGLLIDLFLDKYTGKTKLENDIHDMICERKLKRLKTKINHKDSDCVNPQNTANSNGPLLNQIKIERDESIPSSEQPNTVPITITTVKSEGAKRSTVKLRTLSCKTKKNLTKIKANRKKKNMGKKPIQKKCKPVAAKRTKNSK